MAQRSKTVLVVDDDRDVRDSVVQLLRDAGYHVEQAADGREALMLLDSMRPEPCLVLLDMMMPVMNGEEVLAALAESGRLAALPVVICSGHADRAHGVRRLLRKPVSADVLLRLVEEFCGDLEDPCP